MVLLGVAAVGGGALLCVFLLRFLDTGETYEDWESVPMPFWWLMLMMVVGITPVFGVLGAELPDAVRIVMIGVPVGFALPAWVIGRRRRREA